MVPIVPDDMVLSKFPRFKEKVSTDGEFFYDQDGKKFTAEEYKPIMEEKLKESAAKLPVLVKGEVAWNIVRIDPNHLRITLVDPGYTDPAERSAEIIFQHVKATECRDILSGETLKISDQRMNVIVPAGVFRIIDVTI
jgi:hypothetical protein